MGGCLSKGDGGGKDKGNHSSAKGSTSTSDANERANRIQGSEKKYQTDCTSTAPLVSTPSLRVLTPPSPRRTPSPKADIEVKPQEESLESASPTPLPKSLFPVRVLVPISPLESRLQTASTDQVLPAVLTPPPSPPPAKVTTLTELHAPSSLQSKVPVPAADHRVVDNLPVGSGNAVAENRKSSIPLLQAKIARPSERRSVVAIAPPAMFSDETLPSLERKIPAPDSLNLERKVSLTEQTIFLTPPPSAPTPPPSAPTPPPMPPTPPPGRGSMLTISEE